MFVVVFGNSQKQGKQMLEVAGGARADRHTVRLSDSRQFTEDDFIKCDVVILCEPSFLIREVYERLAPDAEIVTAYDEPPAKTEPRPEPEKKAKRSRKAKAE